MWPEEAVSRPSGSARPLRVKQRRAEKRSPHMPGPRQTLVGDVFHMCIFKPVTDMPRRSAVEPRPGLRRRHGVRPAFSLGVFQRNRSVTAPLGPSGGRSRLPSAPKDSMSQSATLPSLPTKPQVTTQILAPSPCSTDPQESPRASTRLSGLLTAPGLVTGDLSISQREVDIFSAARPMAAAV